MSFEVPTPAPASAARPAIYATGITVEVGRTTLLGPTDLTVGRGSWVNVIGPNGSGKTTLLRALAGLATAQGRIDLAGTALSAMSLRQRSRHIGYVAQQPTMPPGMTIEQYVLLGRAPHLRPMAAEGPSDIAAVATTLSEIGLAKLAERHLDTLSGGERQRAAIARALVQQPELLLLDEPTSALDIGHQQEVLELIETQRRRLGLSVVSTMHDLTLSARYGDHVVLLAGGRTVASGPPIQVLTGPLIEAHYGASVDVIEHGGAPVVVPMPRPSRPLGPSRSSRPLGPSRPPRPDHPLPEEP